MKAGDAQSLKSLRRVPGSNLDALLCKQEYNYYTNVATTFIVGFIRPSVCLYVCTVGVRIHVLVFCRQSLYTVTKKEGIAPISF